MAYGHPSQTGNPKIMGTSVYKPLFIAWWPSPKIQKIQLLTRNAHMVCFFAMGKPKWSSKFMIFDGEASRISGQTHLFQYSLLFERKTGNAGDIRWHVVNFIMNFMGIRYPLSTVTQVSISVTTDPDRVPHIDLLRDLRLAVKELRRHIPGVFQLGGFIWRTWDKSTSEGDVQNIWDNLDIFSGSLKWIYQMYPQVKPPLIKDGMEYDG